MCIRDRSTTIWKARLESREGVRPLRNTIAHTAHAKRHVAAHVTYRLTVAYYPNSPQFDLQHRSDELPIIFIVCVINLNGRL